VRRHERREERCSQTVEQRVERQSPQGRVRCLGQEGRIRQPKGVARQLSCCARQARKRQLRPRRQGRASRPERQVRESRAESLSAAPVAEG
jgi:hypothetical protein